MGDTHRGGEPHTRRHVHPGAPASATHAPDEVPAPAGGHVPPGSPPPSGGYAARGDHLALEDLLAAAILSADVDPDAEQRAVAAFRAARDAGAHRAGTRRRDDWRPRARRPRRSLKAALSVLAASLTLGGVAFAAIGTPGSSSGGSDGPDGDRPGSRPVTSAPGRTADTATGTAPGTSAAPSRTGPADRPDRPGTAKDTEAHCRAWERVRGDGKALDATAWQRLVSAAGGADRVEAYCAEQLAHRGASPAAHPSTAGRPAQPGHGTGHDGRPDSHGTQPHGGTGKTQEAKK
ncbi:hypothetical protein AB0E88_20805 [Streptomyces sp. NPDC028635]|uniref:hypothetical protein n=1 Tax=Streptomyces sp. NPDC028635 TaxID=3154800 RepID=UPI0034083FFD